MKDKLIGQSWCLKSLVDANRVQKDSEVCENVIIRLIKLSEEKRYLRCNCFEYIANITEKIMKVKFLLLRLIY